MTTAPYQEALEAYANPFHEFSVEPLKEGLINQSYKVTSKLTGESFLLQQINKHIFTNPLAVQHNYQKIWDHLSERGKDFILPEPKYFPGDSCLFYDRHNQYWRVFEFVDGGQSISVAENALQAKLVAKAFAFLTSSLRDLDTGELATTIPDFHNLSARYKQFEQSIHHHRFDRLQKASALIEELRKRERYANLFDVFTESEEFPKRVMHHDAKISNVLFDEDSGEIACVVDFDTCMPGYFFSDLGDMIRSMAVAAGEEENNMEAIVIRKDFYEAIMDSYLGELNDQLTSSEKKYIHYAGILMICMQALRFLTDYLNGDVYYRTSYPEQNFDRAKNQIALLQNLEKFLKSEYGFNS